MKKSSNFCCLIKLFLTFLKIGCFSFGGGYAMIPLIEKETCERRKWIQQAELLDIIAISESTPGPISINAATFIGYKVKGFFGSLFATLGLVLPSFVIILLISFIYKNAMSIPAITWIFKGIKAAVVILLFRAFLKLVKTCKMDAFSIILFVITLLGSIVTTILDFNIKIGNFTLSISLIFILLGILLGLISSAITARRKQ